MSSSQRLLGGLVVLTLVLSGCAVLGRVAVRVVMKIGQEVLVTAGAEFVHQLTGGGTEAGRPTVAVNYQDSSRRPVNATYAVDEAEAVSVSGVDGSVQISGDGEQTVVRVAPGSTATIEIVETDSPAPTPERATVPPAPTPDATKIISGTWQGKYRCDQGLTGLKLILYPLGDGTLLGTFIFYAVDENPGLPSGRFALRGTYTDEWFQLEGDYWIDQAAGWGMVGISGAVPSSASRPLTGRLPGTCKNYELTKVSARTSRPPV